MTANLSFGQVINAYIKDVFPATEDRTDSDGIDTISQGENINSLTLPLLHAIVYCALILTTICFLIAFSTLFVSFKPFFTAHRSLESGFENLVCPNEGGYMKLINSFEKVRQNAIIEDGQHLQPNHEGIVYYKHDVELSHLEDVVTYNGIATRFDVASWIQFGLVPSLFKGLNSYNRITFNTIRLSFIRSDKSAFHYMVDKNQFKNTKIHHGKSDYWRNDSKNGVKDETNPVNEDQKKAETDDANVSVEEAGINQNEDSDITYKYEFNSEGQENVYNCKEGNYQYVHGDDIDEMLDSFMQGSSYLEKEPYFPLNAIVSHENTTSVVAEIFTSNVIDGTVSHSCITFDFLRSEDPKGVLVTKRIEISSVGDFNKSQKVVAHDTILVTLILLTVVHVIHSLHITKRFHIFSLHTFYIVDALSKVLLVGCLVTYSVLRYWKSSKLPRIDSVDCNDGYYTAAIEIGRENRLLDNEKSISFPFNVLKDRIITGERLNYIFSVFVFTTVSILFIVFLIFLCEREAAKKRFKCFKSHLIVQIIASFFGISIAILAVSFANIYITDSHWPYSGSFEKVFSTVVNVLVGASSEEVTEYFGNDGFIHVISVLFFISVVLYLGNSLVSTMLLSMNTKDGIESLTPNKQRSAFSDYRLSFFKKVINFIVHFTTPKYNISLLRRMVLGDADTEQLTVFEGDPMTSNIGANIQFISPNRNQTDISDLSTHNDGIKSKYGIYRYVCYFFVILGVIIFAVNDYRYHNVQKVLDLSITKRLYKDRYKWDFTLKQRHNPRLVYKEYNGNALSVVFVINPKTTLPQTKLTNRKDMAEWLTNYGINSLFEWDYFENSYLYPSGPPQKYPSFGKRYYLIPRKNAIFLKIYTRNAEERYLPLFKNMVRDSNSLKLQLLLPSEEGNLGFGSLFLGDFKDVPDVVKHIFIEFYIVDSKLKHKLYRVLIKFTINNCGSLTHSANVWNVFGAHLSSDRNDWILSGIFSATFTLLCALGLILVLDAVNFVKMYNLHNESSSGRYNWKAIAIFFLNDLSRLADLLVIIFLVILLCFYGGILRNSGTFYKNLKVLESLDARKMCDEAAKNIRYFHESLWIILSAIVLLSNFLRFGLIQDQLYIIFNSLKKCILMHAVVGVFFLLVCLTLFLYVYIFSRGYPNSFLPDTHTSHTYINPTEHYKEFSLWIHGLKLLLGDSYVPNELFGNISSGIFVYLFCLLIKSFLLNFSFSYLWSFWPKDYTGDSEKTSKTSKTVESYYEENKKTNTYGINTVVTHISEDQLCLITDEIKMGSTDECLHFFSKFKEYNDFFLKSGWSKLKFVEWLRKHTEDEMRRTSSLYDSFRFKLGILSKQNQIIDDTIDRNLEEHICMLETALSDKQEELTNIFENYKKQRNNQK